MSLISPNQRNADFQEEVQLEVLRRLHQSPDLSQRTLARDLGISLGSINFCLQALVSKGLIKASNFSKSKNKLSYAYLLTPEGLTKKSKLTSDFLIRKLAEYEKLQTEIEGLRSELEVQYSATDS
jgi:EPS-associated MarR family transcriptional regulator